MNIVEIIIRLCWIILILYWIVSSFFQKPAARKYSWFSRFIQFFFMFIAVSLLVGYTIYYPLSIVIVRQPFIEDFISILLCILGLILAIRARTILAGNWSGRVELKKGHELITKGTYKYIRHPIYSGFLMMFLGTALAIGRIGGFIGLLVLFTGFWIKLKQEERLMIKHFGNKYLDYKKRTKALIPYVI